MVDILLASFLVYQYWLLFGVCVLAAFWFPLPATAILFAGGALYAQGYFDITYLIFAGFMGCIIGDALGYWLSYIYGKLIFVRIGFTRFINIDWILEKYGPGFIKRSLLTVFLTRWAVTGLWPSVNIIAWLMRMQPSRFVFVDIIGEFLYIVIYITLWYSFGTAWEEMLDIIESFSLMILSGVLLGMGLYFFWKQTKKRNTENMVPEDSL